MTKYPRKGAKTPVSGVRSARSHSAAFTAEERAAMKERARESRAGARAGKNEAEGERDVLAAISKMPDPDRAIARLGAVEHAKIVALLKKAVG